MIAFVQSWGLWRSFNTTEDKILGTICIMLIALLIYMMYNVVRPRCAGCQKRFWFFQVWLTVTSGGGPETCEASNFCSGCRGVGRYRVVRRATNFTQEQ